MKRRNAVVFSGILCCQAVHNFCSRFCHDVMLLDAIMHGTLWAL